MYYMYRKSSPTVHRRLRLDRNPSFSFLRKSAQTTAKSRFSGYFFVFLCKPHPALSAAVGLLVRLCVLKAAADDLRHLLQLLAVVKERLRIHIVFCLVVLIVVQKRPRSDDRERFCIYYCFFSAFPAALTRKPKPIASIGMTGMQ